MGTVSYTHLDVYKRQEEYRVSHVKGAENVSYQKIEEGHIFPKNKILVLYCDRGGASLKAAKLLGAKGYRTRSVIGGFAAYRGRNLVISR